MSFFAELKRRNVFRVAIAYAVVAWLLVEVSSVVLPTFEAPDWILKVVTFLIALGFPVALIFAWAFEMTPEGLKKERDVDRTQSITQHTGRKLNFAITGLLVVAVGYFAYDKFVLSSGRDAALIEATTQAADQAPTESPDDAAAGKSIAVLPFLNMSADADNEYFSDGITEELLNLLAKIPELKVSSRTSSFAFKGKDIDIPTVAERLGVTKILEGSVRRSGKRVRITAQLIDARSDAHLWSETYDRELEDIFAVQDEIAQHIVEALKVTLSPDEERALESNRSASIEAYDYYLRGRAYFLRTTRESLKEAQAMFKKAIEIDPGYAPAYAWLAIFHAQYFRAYDSLPEHLVKADELSRKAVELAPGLEQAHVARGFALTINQEYAEGERELQAALKLNPRSADAYFYYGQAAYQQGKYEQTAKLWEKATEFDPLDKRAWGLLPQVYRSLGRHDDSLRAHRKSAEVLERGLETNPDDIQDLLSLATARLVLGEREEALASTERILNLAGDDAIVLYNAACLYSLAGETEKAIDTLNKSFAAGLADPIWMEQDSDLDGVRDDPRFKELIERMKASLEKAD